MIQHDAALTVLRAAELIMQDSADTLRPFDLTVAQFNVLRILRGAPAGLSCSQIAERMIRRDPDITRLLDRMEARELITRERSGMDRRVITSRITGCGLNLLKLADPAMEESHVRQFSEITQHQTEQMMKLLGKIMPPSRVVVSAE